jgi:hypothetical protein
MTHANVVTFEARAKLLLNGRRSKLEGKGSIDLRLGFVDGKYHHDMPTNDVDPLIFQTVLITGYPSVCRSSPETANPFHDGDYSYHREIDFGPHGAIQYHANCWLEQRNDDACLQSEFDVQGQLLLPRLLKALPVIEEWHPKLGTVEATFEIVWPTADGTEPVKGRARTTYRPPVASHRIRRRCLRNIVFHHAVAESDQLELIQESWMVPGHRR